MIGKQGISYRGKQETAANSGTLRNPENFLTIVQQVTHFYLLLYEHIHSSLRKDVSCMNPISQNELTAIVTIYIIKK